MARNKRRGLVVIERGGGSGILWLLVGGVVGAGLGILLAPHSGRKTRELLGEKLATLKDSAEDALERLADDGEEELVEGDAEEEEAVLAEQEPVEDGAKDEVAPARRRNGPSARAELEQRLARARARRHRELVEEDEEPVA
jgi:gas vesicle protein